jgi:hypothetical protein
MKKPADKPKHAPAAKHTLEEVLRSLQDLVRNELAENDPEQARNTAKPAGRKARAEKPAVQPEPAKANAEKATTPPLGGIQVELSLPSTGPVAAEKVEPKENAVRQFKANSLPSSKPAAKKPKTLEQTAISWDDEIPVLKDAVPVLQNRVMPPAKTASLPISVSPSERARAIAARAAAELNIELRKAGRPALEPAMIEKLEYLLRQAFESSTPE